MFFICSYFACKLDLIFSPLKSDLSVATSSKEVLYNSQVLKSCIIHIDNKDLKANLIILNLKNFDVILGIN